jgi:hypothetical protein
MDPLMRAGRDRGQATIELVLLIPGLLIGLFLVAGVGLVARADGELAGVAVEAARAGALAPQAAGVEQATMDRALAVAAAYQLHPEHLQLTVDASNFRRGGDVRVQVRYDLPLDGLPLVGGGTVQLQHEAVEPVDSFRSLT